MNWTTLVDAATLSSALGDPAQRVEIDPGLQLLERAEQCQRIGQLVLEVILDRCQRQFGRVLVVDGDALAALHLQVGLEESADAFGEKGERSGDRGHGKRAEEGMGGLTADVFAIGRRPEDLRRT